jgi:hypothetical protein
MDAIIYGIVFLISVFSFLFVITRFHYKFHRHLIVKNFGDYNAVLQLNMEKAYELIYKDRIMTYSLEAFRIPDEEYNIASSDFVRTTQKFLGPALTEQFIELYGDEETFIFVLLEYFSSKYEGDEIRKGAMDNFKESEIK